MQNSKDIGEETFVFLLRTDVVFELEKAVKTVSYSH
jgi:hypothetical protein